MADILSQPYDVQANSMNEALCFIRNDFKSNKVRFVAEVCAMSSNLFVAILLLITTPHPPMIAAYVGWLTATSLLLVCSYNRRSFGMVTMYAVYILIDGLGLIKTILQ
jgi:hypothetical protein